MKKKKKRTNQYIVVAGLTAASLVSGCDKSVKEWPNSPGTNGFVNLDAVKKAFQDNPKVEDFEERVNEVFEGDNLIIFESQELNKGFVYTAKEDLDKDTVISSGDETLFTLTVANGKATLQGAGVNKYYKETWSYKPVDKDQPSSERHHHHTHFYHWYGMRGWGGYYTPRQSYNRISGSRDSYRQGSAFVSQVNNNVGFENRMTKRYGTGFRKSVSDVSSVRKSYINTTKKSSGFKGMLSKNKSSSLRSKSSTKGGFTSARSSSKAVGRSGGRSGGFRGSSGFSV
jgi:hypothetical protein